MFWFFPLPFIFRSNPASPPHPHNHLLTPHGRRIILVTPTALLTPAVRVARVGDLGARDGADVDALAVGLVQLEARRALLVGPHRRRLDAVARVGAHEDGLPDDVVAGLAVRAQAQRRVNFVARGGAVEGWLMWGLVG